MQNGNLAQWRYGLNGNPDPAWRSVAVTFVDNHDTGYSPGTYGGQHHWPLPEHLRDQAYAYILSSPGTPTVYWPDMYDWPRGEMIRQLIQIRRTAGIKADSPVSFPANASGLVAEVTGSSQILLIALGSDFNSARLPASFTPALVTGPDQAIRLWRANAVTVRLQCDQARQDDSVYAVGSGLELGEWDPARAVRLSDPQQGMSSRQLSLRLAENARYEWKCIVRDETDPGRVIKWQEGPNSVFVAQEGGSSAGGF
jgi:alpha-amylase